MLVRDMKRKVIQEVAQRAAELYIRKPDYPVVPDKRAEFQEAFVTHEPPVEPILDTLNEVVNWHKVVAPCKTSVNFTADMTLEDYIESKTAIESIYNPNFKFTKEEIVEDDEDERLQSLVKDIGETIAEQLAKHSIKDSIAQEKVVKIVLTAVDDWQTRNDYIKGILEEKIDNDTHGGTIITEVAITKKELYNMKARARRRKNMVKNGYKTKNQTN